MTLYAFLNDTDGESTCTGDCLANWPAAVIGEHDASVLDPALWSTVENPEAGAMLKVGDWPLYTFAGDAAPGDVNGQGVGEVWYAVAPDGTIIEGEITVTEFAAGTDRHRHPAGTDARHDRLNPTEQRRSESNRQAAEGCQRGRTGSPGTACRHVGAARAGPSALGSGAPSSRTVDP